MKKRIIKGWYGNMAIVDGMIRDMAKDIHAHLYEEKKRVPGANPQKVTITIIVEHEEDGEC